MIQANDVRRFFQDRHPWMVRILTPVFTAKFKGNAERIDDSVQNAIGLAYRHTLIAVDKNEIPDAETLVTVVKGRLFFSVKQTCSGRMVHRHTDPSKKKFRDVMDVPTWLALEELERGESDEALASLEALATYHDDPADKATLRIDFEAFAKSLTYRQKCMIMDMLAGYSTSELAESYGVSLGAISQWRRKFLELWNSFTEL